MEDAHVRNTKVVLTDIETLVIERRSKRKNENKKDVGGT